MEIGNLTIGTRYKITCRNTPPCVGVFKGIINDKPIFNISPMGDVIVNPEYGFKFRMIALV